MSFVFLLGKRSPRGGWLLHGKPVSAKDLSPTQIDTWGDAQNPPQPLFHSSRGYPIAAELSSQTKQPGPAMPEHFFMLASLRGTWSLQQQLSPQVGVQPKSYSVLPASQVPIRPSELFSPSKVWRRDNLLGNGIASGTSENKSVGTGSFPSSSEAFPYPRALLF